MGGRNGGSAGRTGRGGGDPGSGRATEVILTPYIQAQDDDECVNFSH